MQNIICKIKESYEINEHLRNFQETYSQWDRTIKENTFAWKNFHGK